MDALLCSGVSLVGVTDPLQVRNSTTGSDDNEFAPPDKPGVFSRIQIIDSLDIGVKVPGNENGRAQVGDVVGVGHRPSN